MQIGLVLTPRAEISIANAETWWRKHGDASDALASEIAQALAVIREHPGIGQLKRTRQGKPIRRYTLEVTRYYLFFYRVHRDHIEVISLWHTSRRPPRL